MSATERSLRKREEYTNKQGKGQERLSRMQEVMGNRRQKCELIIYISLCGIRGWGSGEPKSRELEALWLWQEKIDQMSCEHVEQEKHGNKRCLACAFEKTNDEYFIHKNEERWNIKHIHGVTVWAWGERSKMSFSAFVTPKNYHESICILYNWWLLGCVQAAAKSESILHPSVIYQHLSFAKSVTADTGWETRHLWDGSLVHHRQRDKHYSYISVEAPITSLSLGSEGEPTQTLFAVTRLSSSPGKGISCKIVIYCLFLTYSEIPLMKCQIYKMRIRPNGPL